MTRPTAADLGLSADRGFDTSSAGTVLVNGRPIAYTGLPAAEAVEHFDTAVVNGSRAEVRRLKRLVRQQAVEAGRKPPGPGRATTRIMLRSVGHSLHKGTATGAPRRTSLLYLLNRQEIDHERQARTMARDALRKPPEDASVGGM